MKRLILFLPALFLASAAQAGFTVSTCGGQIPKATATSLQAVDSAFLDINENIQLKLNNNGYVVTKSTDQLKNLDKGELMTKFDSFDCKKYPETCVIREWDPDTENEADPFEDKLKFCNTYPDRCQVNTDLLHAYIGKLNLIEPTWGTKKPELKLVDVDFKCLGISCAEGQVCNDGCCEFKKQLIPLILKDKLTVEPITLSTTAMKKYTLVKDSGLPVRLQPATGTILRDATSVNDSFILNLPPVQKKLQLIQAETLKLKQ